MEDPVGSALGMRILLSIQFLSFSCSFRQKCCQIIVWCPSPGTGVFPLGNPGSAIIFLLIFFKIWRTSPVSILSQSSCPSWMWTVDTRLEFNPEILAPMSLWLGNNRGSFTIFILTSNYGDGYDNMLFSHCIRILHYLNSDLLLFPKGTGYAPWRQRG